LYAAHKNEPALPRPVNIQNLLCRYEIAYSASRERFVQFQVVLQYTLNEHKA
jgi:hypothetical protein